MMKYNITAILFALGTASASALVHQPLEVREVPQEHSHNRFLDLVRTSLAIDNPQGITDPVFGLLGDAAAAAGAGTVTNLECLQQATADQAFTNAKAAGDVGGMAGALLYRAIERNTGSVGLASAICEETATNPEIAAITQHQDPASSGAAAVNKGIVLALAKQLAAIGADPLLALESGTFAPGTIGDPTAAGNTCDTEDDDPGCIFSQSLLVLDATEAEISSAVAATLSTVTSATTTATTEAAGVNVQVFTGTLGGSPPAVVSGTGDRPFSVNGDTFVNAGAALQRSCSIQHNACADAANSGTLSGGVQQCETQETACNAADGVTKKKKRALDFGTCGDPTVLFEAGLDGRNTDAFIAADQTSFNHGSALNIGVIAGFICQRLGSPCSAPADVQASCTSASAAAVATTQDQAAADVFNSILGVSDNAVTTSATTTAAAAAAAHRALMPVLNPFLRALFQSSVLAHARPAQDYVILAPSTESLIYGVDTETGKRYADTVDDEDFLGSHVLRIPPLPPKEAKEANVRDGRAKAKTYPTVTGRTVIVKEHTVFTNKGFKLLTQAQLLQDALYYSPSNETQQWLVYYISKPLLGSYESAPIRPATLPVGSFSAMPANTAAQLQKRDIKSFNELLNSFPMIARQMQPGLERLFNEFGKELGKPLPPPPSQISSSDSVGGSTQVSDGGSAKTNGISRLPFPQDDLFEDEEDMMRKALETAVTAGIDLFQGVDKQQLSLLGATTDLTGPTVERLIERYVAESVHDSLLFPKLCLIHKTEDQELDRRIRQMDCLDVAQVGIAIEDGQDGKKDLLTRIESGVAAFRKLGVAGSPQQMLDILVETERALSETGRASTIADEEKRATAMTINADILVSLLLLVVIRAQVRHLQARLAYMQRFIFIDDVESGEIGYALSTFEAVLVYLSRDAGGLRKASRQNKVLWDAVKYGNLDEVKSLFHGSSCAIVDDFVEEPALLPMSRATTASSLSSMNGSISKAPPSEEGGLAHVFPFQAKEAGKKVKKHVKMLSRSVSASSSFSQLSRSATIETTLSGIEGDTSVPSLAQTQDSLGNSVLRMAVESQQVAVLQYLFTLSDHFPINVILNDTSSDGTTLLSAAIQLANLDLVRVILEYLMQNLDESMFKDYIAVQDSRGRTAAHYIFNTPELIKELAELIPWRQKDKIGHTPLFAVCRTYDHADYSNMVSEALSAAKDAQQDDGPLRVEDHNDDKGNSLLHIVKDSSIAHRILYECDVDPNTMNDKKFTPLMLASKYGRIDMVRIFFGDPRIDIHLRESRGLTAVELAKDDEVRNRIDDLTLFSTTAASSTAASTGRITAIVRSFFVEDGSTRFVLKSGAPNSAVSSTTYTITTSRRSVADFQNLALWLTMDNPASYMPVLKADMFRTPFQLHSRPSRSVLYDAQTTLDRFLKVMISHPTFGQHEMLWEFFLVPDMALETIAERAKLKAELMQEKIQDEYEPMTSSADLRDVESVILHSRDLVRKVGVSTRALLRKGNVLNSALGDVAEAVTLLAQGVGSLGAPSLDPLPKAHVNALSKFALHMQTESVSNPLAIYLDSLRSFNDTVNAMQTSLSKPSMLISRITGAKKRIDKDKQSLLSNTGPKRGPFSLNLPGMEESRLKNMKEAEKRVIEGEGQVEALGKELRYTNEVVVSELAGWTTWKGELGKEEVKRYVKGMVIKERERLHGMQRVLRTLRERR
ncbi:hypothetical protein DV737_g399, partial [Chaetothyriales sp. CBS 132003]